MISPQTTVKEVVQHDSSPLLVSLTEVGTHHFERRNRRSLTQQEAELDELRQPRQSTWAAMAFNMSEKGLRR